MINEKSDDQTVSLRIVVDDKTYIIKDAIERTVVGSTTCKCCAFLKTDLVYCQDIIRPIAKEQLKSNYPIHSVIGGCGINEIVFIEDNIDSIMDYLEVKFNNEEK